MSANAPNILLLTKIFSPPKTGGVPNYYKNLLQNLNKIKAVVITSGLKNVPHISNYSESKKKKYSIKRIDFFPEYMGLQLNFVWLISIIRMVQTIVKTVKTNRIDIIIVGQVQMFLLLPAFIAGLFTRKPYVLFLHGEEIPQIPMKSNRILKWLYLQSSGYFCNSDFTAERLKRFTKLNKINPVIITPGVEDRFFEKPAKLKDVKNRLNMNGKKNIYTIARLDKRKGHDMVIKALPLIIEKHPDVVYLIGGKGPGLRYLQELMRNNALESHVRFLGFVQENDLVVYHNAGDIFVMPNRILEDGDSEGFGIVFIEANAVGNPVIGGNEGGSVDAVVDGITGLLVDPKNKKDIAEKICCLLDDERRRREMGRLGRERSLSRFRWPALSEKFETSVIDMWRNFRE
ncbi:MAG: glycosyltransferase family 4 protein [Deltaproteobacteria bacterium]|nr:glycosyltransferase family 4 protein [Deltaproteobacteria bacterium]